jgi:hypothetical protein
VAGGDPADADKVKRLAEGEAWVAAVLDQDD